jgi:hypothetical protein
MTATIRAERAVVNLGLAGQEERESAVCFKVTVGVSQSLSMHCIAACKAADPWATRSFVGGGRREGTGPGRGKRLCSGRRSGSAVLGAVWGGVQAS